MTTTTTTTPKITDDDDNQRSINDDDHHEDQRTRLKERPKINGDERSTTTTTTVTKDNDQRSTMAKEQNKSEVNLPPFFRGLVSRVRKATVYHVVPINRGEWSSCPRGSSHNYHAFKERSQEISCCSQQREENENGEGKVKQGVFKGSPPFKEAACKVCSAKCQTAKTGPDKTEHKKTHRPRQSARHPACYSEES